MAEKRPLNESWHIPLDDDLSSEPNTVLENLKSKLSSSCDEDNGDLKKICEDADENADKRQEKTEQFASESQLSSNCSDPCNNESARSSSENGQECSFSSDDGVVLVIETPDRCHDQQDLKLSSSLVN